MDFERTSTHSHRSLAQRLRTLSLAVQVLCIIGAVAAVSMALSPLWNAQHLLSNDYSCAGNSLLSKLSGPPTFETLQRMVLVNVPVLVVQCALLWQLWGLFAEFHAGRLFSDKALQCWQRWGWGVAALLAGDVQMIEAVPTADIARLEKDPKVAVASAVSNRLIYLHMDSDRAVSPFVSGRDGKPLDRNPFKDARVRKAVSLAIDRNAIVSRIMEGHAQAAGQLLPEFFPGTSKKLPPPKPDPEAARKLLAEAGYPNGFSVVLHTPNNRYINDEKVAQAIAGMLSRVGIETKLEAMPSNVFFSRAGKLDFSFLLAGWGAETGETSSPLRALIGMPISEAFSCRGVFQQIVNMCDITNAVESSNKQ